MKRNFAYFTPVLHCDHFLPCALQTLHLGPYGASLGILSMTGCSVSRGWQLWCNVTMLCLLLCMSFQEPFCHGNSEFHLGELLFVDTVIHYIEIHKCQVNKVEKDTLPPLDLPMGVSIVQYQLV